ncbi:MAG: cytochrome c oxidase subunit II, partial [Gammaproteobacteria bacterium]
MFSMRNPRALMRLLVSAVGLGVTPAFASLGELNMPVGVTETSSSVYDLHMIILWICVIIGIVVFGAMAYSMYAHRKSKGVTPATFHESTTLEIIWTVIPFAILVVMAVPATTTLVDMYDTSDADMTVKVTGYQWKWEYEYVEDGVKFFSTLDAESNMARQHGAGELQLSKNGQYLLNAEKKIAAHNPDGTRTSIDDDQAAIDAAVAKGIRPVAYLLDVDKPLVIPAGKKVRFLLTASDVIHAWWVPEFGWKKDAIPGFINEMWIRADETGTYRGQCAELCGKDHGYMPIVVD